MKVNTPKTASEIKKLGLGFHQNELPNRQARRNALKTERFKGNKKGISLTVESFINSEGKREFVKYKRKTQFIGNKPVQHYKL